jgi:hypothetical protein
LFDDHNNNIAQFLEMIHYSSFCPVINIATRVTKTTKSLIDNKFSNAMRNQALCNNVLISDISDHFPIYIILNNKIEKRNKKEMNNFIVKCINNKKLIRLISNYVNNEHIYNSYFCINSSTEAYDIFTTDLVKIINCCSTNKLVPLKFKKPHPWIKKSMIQQSNIKSQLLKRYLITKKSVDYDKYKKQRN